MREQRRTVEPRTEPGQVAESFREADSDSSGRTVF